MKTRTDNGALIPVSDFFKLAALDLLRIAPEHFEYHNRYWAYFLADQAQKVLEQYDSGALTGCLRDYAASLERVKTRIFESERMARNGAQYGNESRHK